jgi:hypothetical protein
MFRPRRLAARSLLPEPARLSAQETRFAAVEYGGVTRPPYEQ